MPCRKSRPSRHPTFSLSTMDTSDDDDDDVSIYETRGEIAERIPSPQRELPLDLSVRTLPEIDPPKDYAVLRKVSHDDVNNVDERYVNDVIHGERFVMVGNNGSDIGPPHLGEPYLEIAMPLDLKYMNAPSVEECEEPQDLSLRNRCPPIHYTSSPPSSSSSTSSSPSFSTGTSGTHMSSVTPPNGIRVAGRFSSDPHLRHHKRERLEEMVNHIRKCSARPIPAVGDPSTIGSLHHHMPSNAMHSTVKRSISCSSFPPPNYLHRHRQPDGVVPPMINPASHERLLACLAQPPLRNPGSASGEVGIENESLWRPEDIFDLSDSGDNNNKKPHSGQFPLDQTGQKFPNHYPPSQQQQIPNNFLLQRFMTSSLSLMNTLEGNALFRHFSNIPPTYLSWMAYNYYVHLSQMGANTPRNGTANATAASGMATSPVSPSSPVISTKVETPSSPATTVTEDSKSDHALSPPSFSPNTPTTDIPRKRAPRALTGKHVKHGTGASPSTLLTLRQKIEQRQRIRQVVGDHRPPQRGRLPPNKRKLTST